METLLTDERRRSETAAAALSALFQPRSIAVIGASRNPARIGGQLLEALLQSNFAGAVYPVNPRATVVRGLTCFASACDLPEPVDLAIVAVPPEALARVVEDCAERGVKSLMLQSAKEGLGEGWPQLQQHIVEFARDREMRLLGPNGLGLISTDSHGRLNASLASVLPRPGRVAVAAESRSLGVALLSAAARRGVGISSFVGLGERIDISSNDLLEYWEDDPHTDVILLCLKSFGNPRRFARIARRVSRRKPIVALKSSAAVKNPNADVLDAFVQQNGLIRADDVEEMLDLTAALSHQPLPLGRRVGIVSNAGAAGQLCATACTAAGLAVPECSEDTKISLAARLPAGISLRNPIDLTPEAAPEYIRWTVETLAAAGEFDALIYIHLLVGDPSEAAQHALAESVKASRATRGGNLPVLACFLPMSGAALLEAAAEQVPMYPFPETAARVLGKLADYAEWRAQPPSQLARQAPAIGSAVRDLCRQHTLAAGSGWLTTAQTREVLQSYGLPVAPGGVAATAADAVDWAERIGFPVAMKLAYPHWAHKLEALAIYFDLQDSSEARDAFHHIQSCFLLRHAADEWPGVLVEPMLPAATEVMVRVKQDQQWGALVEFGLAGVRLEALDDVCRRTIPLSERDAADMIRSLRGFRLFEGYRGHPRADVAAIEKLLIRTSQLVEDVPEIEALELHPVFVMSPGDGCSIVDARLSVRREQQ